MDRKGKQLWAVHVWGYLSKWVNVCMCVWQVHVCVQVCLCVYVFMFVYVCMYYVFMFVYVRSCARACVGGFWMVWWLNSKVKYQANILTFIALI